MVFNMVLNIVLNIVLFIGIAMVLTDHTPSIDILIILWYNTIR